MSNEVLKRYVIHVPQEINNFLETEDFYKDIADDVEERFDASGYVDNRPLPSGKNKKVIGLMKDELG